MISITQVRVTGFDRRYLDVDWEIAPTHDDMQEWEFFVERSESEAGPWDVIAGPIIDRYYVRDNSTPQFAFNRVLIYRIRAANTLRSVEVVSGVADREGELDLIGAEIVSLEHLLFTEFAGTRAWLFPRRTFGQRCPQCWDDALAKRLDDSCTVCWGTGFSGGYHYPVECFIQFDRNPTVEISSTYDHYQQNTLTLRTTASPRITPLSLIIDHRNQRFRVLSVSATTRLGVSVHQEAQAVQLSPSAIEAAIPLQVDHREVTHAASRNYTNPHTIEAASSTPADELDRLLGRYGYRDDA